MIVVNLHVQQARVWEVGAAVLLGELITRRVFTNHWSEFGMDADDRG